MSRVTLKKIIFFLLAVSFAACALGAESWRELTGRAEEKYARHDYREAFDLYKKALLQKNYDGRNAADDLARAVDSLQELGAENEFDPFIESLVAVHADDWRILKEAAVQYRDIEEYGYIVGGEFQRGDHRGGQGRFVVSAERDRVRSLQLLQDALDLARRDRRAGRDAVKSVLQEMSHAVMWQRDDDNAWKLQHLTDLTRLPDYQDGYDYGNREGAPVDENGDPVFYALPENFKAAKNDGERWRYLLNEIASFSEKDRQESLWRRAEFLWQQFGVQTIADSAWLFEQGVEEDAEREKSIYRLNSLGDGETIAKLANGIKRFNLPDEHNSILIYKQLAQQERYGAQATERLATLYENRRQLKTAAGYWRQAIDRFDSTGKDWQARLDQIIGAWARFEPNKTTAAGDNSNSVYLRFRNASRVQLTMYELKADRFLADLKSYLESNPKELDWSKLQLQAIGYQVINKQQQQYRGRQLKNWTQDLDPSEQHYDRRANITLPENIVGPYLLEATVAGGNTSFIVVWNTEAVIVKKPMAQGELYFIADSLTGKPKPDTSLTFFGYRGEWYDDDNNSNTRNRLRILTKSFHRSSDRRGQIELDKQLLDAQYRWLVHTDSSKRGFAYLGFENIWYRPVAEEPDDRTKAYVITSQPAYRPGQKIDFKVWIHQARYEQPDKSVYAGRKFNVVIHNPRGEEVLNKTFLADDYGGINGTLTLDKSAALGTYGIEVKNIAGGGYFLLEEYKKPEFEVSVDAPSEPVQLGEKIQATIKANYLFGAPVAEATVKYRVMRYNHEARWFPATPWDWLYGRGYWWFAYDAPGYPDWKNRGMRMVDVDIWRPRYEPPELVMENETDIGADGVVNITIDTGMAGLLHPDTDHRYEIIAEVTDRSRRTIIGKGEVLAARKPFQVYVWVDKGYYRPGDAIQVNVAAKTINQKPVSGKGELGLFRLRYDNNKDVAETLVQNWKLDSENGDAEITLKAAAAGQYRLSYTVKDKSGNKVEGGYLFNVIGDAAQAAEDYRFNDLELIPDKKQYAPGEKVRLLINSSHNNASILLFLRPQNGVYGKRKLITLEGNSALVDIDVSGVDMPNFFVEALTVVKGNVFTQVREIAVPPEQRVLNVDLIPNKTEFQPGEKANLKVKVTDTRGKPFVGSTVIAVYDKALEYISGGGNSQDIKEFFWNWRRHHSANTRDSAQQYFNNQVREGEKTLQRIGVFGDRLPEENRAGDDGAQVEEIVVTGIRASLAEAADVKRKSVGVVDASFAPSAEPLAGGDTTQRSDTEIHIRKDFADKAYWTSDITTNKAGVAEVEFAMPENLTSWKASAWVMGHGTKVGHADSNLVTTKKLLLRLQAPRFFVETDEVVLSANIHNYLKHSEPVKASLQLQGDNLELLGEPVQQVSVASNGEARIDWRVRVRREGEAKIRMVAEGKTESDAMEMNFPVYVHGMLKKDSFSGALSASQNNGVIDFTVPEERRPEQTRFELRYSPTLAGAMVDALPYLANYPYGCTEQTLNRFLPTVTVQNILKRTGIDLKSIQQKQVNLNAQELGDEDTRAGQWRQRAWEEHNPVFDEQQVQSMVQAGLERLYSMQLTDGGWGWFSGWGERSSAHMTAQVMHGLQVVRQNGVQVNEDVYQRGLNWLRYYQAQEVQKLKNVNSKTEPNKAEADNIDAFVAFVLAPESVSEKDFRSMLDYLYRDRQHLSVYGETLLALGLTTANRIPERDQVRSNIEQFLVQDDENQTAYLNLKNSGYWWFWYGSEIEAQAYYLKLLAQIEPNSAVAPRLVKYLLNNRKNATYWNSTRDTALVIEAMADYLIASGEANPDMAVDLILDGDKIKTVKLDRENLFSFDNKLVLEGDQLTTGAHQLELRKRGNGPLYYNAYLDNFTLENFISHAGLEVKVQRRYYKLEPEKAAALVRGGRGQALEQQVKKYRRVPIERDYPLQSGDLVEVELLLESKNDYEYILIEDMKAAGFEPLEVRSGYNGNELSAYVEYRDNRVAFFVTHLARGKHSVSYRLKAEIPGSFSALPTKVEAMYAPEIKANSDEEKIVIEEQI